MSVIDCLIKNDCLLGIKLRASIEFYLSIVRSSEASLRASRQMAPLAAPQLRLLFQFNWAPIWARLKACSCAQNSADVFWSGKPLSFVK